MSSSKITVGTILILEDETDPISIGGVDAPIGSIFTAEDGTGVFLKTGSGDNDWTQIAYTKDLGTYIFLTGGDQSTTSASATAITDLVTPTLEANSRYVIYGHIHLGCDNTGGVLFACDIPSGSVFLTYIGRTNSGTAFRQIANAVDATLFTGAFNTFNNANGGVAIFGEITTGVTAGTAQLMFASGTAGQTSTIYQLGTYLFIKKIA